MIEDVSGHIFEHENEDLLTGKLVFFLEHENEDLLTGKSGFFLKLFKRFWKICEIKVIHHFIVSHSSPKIL